MMLIFSFIMSKLDYCINVALVGITRCDLDRLQSVINAVARLMVGEHCAALRPHLTSSRRPSLAADGRTYKLCVQLYDHISRPLPTRTSTMLPSADSTVRWRAWNHGVVCGQSHGAYSCYTEVNTG